MKYIRKVMAIGLAIVFLIALVIGTGIILSVRNVNVTYLTYADESEEAQNGELAKEYARTRERLNGIKGSGLLFIDEEDVAGKITAPDLIALVGYEKKFPCTVDVILRERVETFAVKTETGFSVYDEEGKLIKRVTDDGDVRINGKDGSPDVMLDVRVEQIEPVAKMCAYFKENFGSLRRTVSSVSTTKILKIATIRLRSGLTVSISDWENDTERKIRKAYEAYAKLSDKSRTGGSITVVDGSDNSGPVADYATRSE